MSANSSQSWLSRCNAMAELTYVPNGIASGAPDHVLHVELQKLLGDGEDQYAEFVELPKAASRKQMDKLFILAQL